MIEWNEKRLEELVRKMGLEQVPGQGETPIHLSLYGPFWKPEPLLTKIMQLGAGWWTALGYTETDRVSVTRYLCSLGCRAGGALWAATMHQQPLTLELAKLLIDAGAFDKEALRIAAEYQQPLTLELAKLLIDAGSFSQEALRWAAKCQQPLSLELAKLLIDAGCDPTVQDWRGWDALVYLAYGGRPADPQVTDLFLSAGCLTDLNGCRSSAEHSVHFDQILKKHAEWKGQLDLLLAENSPADSAVDWDR